MRKGRGLKRDHGGGAGQPPLFVDTSQQPMGQYGNPEQQQFNMEESHYYYRQRQFHGDYTNSGYMMDSQQTDYYGSPGMAQQPPQMGTNMQFGGFSMPGAQFLQDPTVTNMAMQYGTQMVGQGTQFVQANIENYVATSRLKYYFAVDNAYVGKKLFLLMFPFSHSNWAVTYDQQNTPVAPRYDVNAPDLYIPVMAFVTYILTTGIVLGTQNRFNPEQLGMQSSTALGWLIIEILLLMFTLYVMSIQTSLRYLDLIAYAGYKFVGMIAILLCGLFFHVGGYYFALLWFSCSLAFFLVRTLKIQILPHTHEATPHGNKRRIYLLLVIAGIQPILMWWLTSYIIFPKKY